MPVEASGRTFVFGEAQSRVEAIAPDIEGKTAEGAVEGDGDRDSDDRGVGDVDGTTSSGDVD